MHARELIEVAIMVSQRKTNAVSAVADADAHYHDYWLHSRSRLHVWHKALQSYYSYLREGGTQLFTHFPDAESIIHEILLSEVLTRIWTAESARYDEGTGANEFEPISRNVFISHEDARHRTLRLLTLGTGFSSDELTSLNRLRRSCERWTDLLLSNYASELDVQHLAFDTDRMLDFADEHRRAAHQQKQQWRLLAASARHAFHVRSTVAAANPKNNRCIAEAISPFIVAPPVTPRQPTAVETRMDDIAVEAQRMLDDLILLEG